MSFTELSPAELLSTPLDAAVVNDRGWCVRWDEVGPEEAHRLVSRHVPDAVEFMTSGTTGAQRRWTCDRDQLWNEAGLLASLVGSPAPGAMVSFAPPKHRYGALVSVLLPARLGIPAWTTPKGIETLPIERGGSPWLVAAIPWTFTLLRRASRWVRQQSHVTVLHSTATLPKAAQDLVADVGDAQLRIVEVFGSTESGAVASRAWTPGNPPWTLVDGVSWADGTGCAEATALAVHSPLLARASDGTRPQAWTLDDIVRRTGDRGFVFEGRRGRLVKVNGRRIDLDHLEGVLRDNLPCTDLACVPVTEAVIGEHFDLHVVPRTGRRISHEDVRAAVRVAGVAPRQVAFVTAIHRSETGKLRKLQDPAGGG